MTIPLEGQCADSLEVSGCQLDWLMASEDRLDNVGGQKGELDTATYFARIDSVAARDLSNGRGFSPRQLIEPAMGSTPGRRIYRHESFPNEICLNRAAPLLARCESLMDDVKTLLSNALDHLAAGRPSDARALYAHVLEGEGDALGASAAHDIAAAYDGVGMACFEQLELDQANAAFEKAIAIRPRWAIAHYHRGQTLLLGGHFAEGWEEYEWRLHIPEFQHRHFSAPRWNGEPLAGRTLLVICEQGYGDVFQFVRFLPAMGDTGGRVVFECPGGLAELLEPLLPADQVVALSGRGPPTVAFDTYVSLLSLPRCRGTTLDSIPNAVPYLTAPRPTAAPVCPELADPGFKVGLVWAGRPSHPDDRQRSTGLAVFAPLGRIPDLRLFSLQTGEAAAQATSPPAGLSLHPLTPWPGSFAHTAAVIDRLDLVITVDTAVAHLAGALGKPVWTLLPFAPDWRWLTAREDSPWYPTMRLFRQEHPGDWAGVVERVATALRGAVDSAGC